MDEDNNVTVHERMIGVLSDNAQRLRKWNEHNFDANPEQARKNTDTLVNIYRLIFEIEGIC